MCDSATHAALNSPKPRACLRLTPYRPTNAASRSLHSYQPYAWLRHTPYLRTAQILKPRCSNCIFHPVGQNTVATQSMKHAYSAILAYLRHIYPKGRQWNK